MIEPKQSVPTHSFLLGMTIWCALTAASSAQTNVTGPIPSQGHYRLPFADGTGVKVFDDFLTQAGTVIAAFS